MIDKVALEVEQADADVIHLLETHTSPAFAHLWIDARLYVAFVKRLLQAGHATRAFDLCREGLNKLPDETWLRYYASLALARGGNGNLAWQYLEPLLNANDLEPHYKIEVLSLAGRLAKDKFERATEARHRA